MVIAHAGCPDAIWNFIYRFHMPLFFIMSGYCFKEKWLSDYKGYILRRVETIYLPFVKWSIFFLLLHNIFYECNIYNDIYGWHSNVSYRYEIIDFFKRGFNIITRMSGNEQLLGGYWFLKSLFWGSLIFYGVLKINIKFLGLLLLVLTFLFSIFELKIPFFNINSRDVFSSFFIYTGYIIKKYDFKFYEKPLYIITGFMLVAISSIILKTEMLSFHWHDIIPLYISALLGSLMIFGLCINIQNFLHKKIFIFLEYIGTHTLVILTWHFLSFKLVSLLLIWINNWPIEKLSIFPVIPAVMNTTSYFNDYWWLYGVVGIIVPLIMCKIADEFKKLKLVKNIIVGRLFIF